MSEFVDGRCTECNRSPEGCACDLTFVEKLRSVNVDKSSLHPEHIRLKRERGENV